jgi:hypothetical protein
MSDPAASAVRLETVLRRFGHTADLKDGKISVDGVEIDFVEVEPAILVVSLHVV